MTNNKHTIVLAIALSYNYCIAKIPSGYNELAWGQSLQISTEKYPGGSFEKDTDEGFVVTKYTIKNPSPTINERQFIFDENSKLIKVHITYDLKKILSVSTDFTERLLSKFGRDAKSEKTNRKVNGINIDINTIQWESTSTRILLKIWQAAGIDGAAGIQISYLSMDHLRRVNQKKVSEIEF